MSTSPRIISLAAALPLASALFFGPPSIKVTIVTDRASAPTQGAVLAVTAQHHAENEPLTVTGQIEGLLNGKRITRPLVVTPAQTRGSFGVAPQWEVGKPWVLVLSTGGGDHGTAVALVRVSAEGKILGAESPNSLRSIGSPLSRTAIEDAVVASLKTLGAK